MVFSMVHLDVVSEAPGVFCNDEVEAVVSESVTSRRIREFRVFSARNTTLRIVKKEDGDYSHWRYDRPGKHDGQWAACFPISNK